MRVALAQLVHQRVTQRRNARRRRIPRLVLLRGRKQRLFDRLRRLEERLAAMKRMYRLPRGRSSSTLLRITTMSEKPTSSSRFATRNALCPGRRRRHPFTLPCTLRKCLMRNFSGYRMATDH